MVVGHFLYYDFCPSLISSVTAWSRQTLLLLVYYIYSYTAFAHSSPLFLPHTLCSSKSWASSTLTRHNTHSIVLHLTKRLGFRGIFFPPPFWKAAGINEGIFTRKRGSHCVKAQCNGKVCIWALFTTIDIVFWWNVVHFSFTFFNFPTSTPNTHCAIDLALCWYFQHTN